MAEKLSADRRVNRLRVVREIMADCERDVAKLETRPFDARNVAEVFGELYGTLSGLANVVRTILEEDMS